MAADGPRRSTGAGRLAGLARAVSWHRGLLAGGLAAGAVALGLQALQPPPPPTVDVLAPVADLPGGVRLTSADLRPVALPEDIVPEGALRPDEDVEGRVLAGPVRAGEPLTDVRLLGRSLLDGWGDALVATPVRVADEGAVALVRPGDRVDLIATDTMGEAQAHVVAAGVPVLATPPGGEDVSFTEGALLVVASSREQAGRLAAAAVTSRLSLSLRPPPSDP